MSQTKYKGPIVLAILDGVGLSREIKGNAVLSAKTPFLDRAVTNYPAMALRASGEAVGLEEGVMGNSEVGHNTLGAGQMIKQGIGMINEAFRTGAVWGSKAWQKAVEAGRTKTLHFAGIFSDGGVHSDMAHLEKMIEQAYSEGVKRIRIHLVLDGRDVSPQSALEYIERLLSFLAKFQGVDYGIASGGGRMVFVADRYENDWEIVRRGWEAMVWGRAERYFRTATEAIKTLRAENPKLQDQYCPSFVIRDERGEAVGKIEEGDSIIYYDFRADRAIEIAQAFTYEEFPYFERGTEHNRRLEVFFAGMTEYNSDTHVPEYRLVEPVEIRQTLSQFLSVRGTRQLAVAERAKYGHITYYFNGNSYRRFENEDMVEIMSDSRPFNERPWMKAAETADVVIDNIDKYEFIRVNFAGGDMVGHFGEMRSTVMAMEAIDLQLGRIAEAVDRAGGMMIITADHGNAEEIIDSKTGEPKTAHTLNKVPCIFYDNTPQRENYKLKKVEGAGLANVAATVAELMGLMGWPVEWEESLIKAA